MRLLNRNMIGVWKLSDKKERVEILDEFGYPTGEYEIVYEEPILIKAHINQVSGKMKDDIFGTKSESSVTIVTKEKLSHNDLLFLEEPKSIDEWDYRINERLKSLNEIIYGGITRLNNEW